MGSDYYLDRDYGYRETISELKKQLKQKDDQLKALKSAVKDYFTFSEFLDIEADAQEMVDEAKRTIESILNGK